MARVIELPKLSPTMEEGTLVRWAKREGDAINIDDLLAEVETDKATMEFRSFDRGTLLKTLVPEGAVTKLGQPVAIFGEPGEDVSALVPRGFTSPMLFDPTRSVVAGRYGTRLFPETWIIDGDGVIRARFDHTLEWSSPVFVQYVTSLR